MPQSAPNTLQSHGRLRHTRYIIARRICHVEYQGRAIHCPHCQTSPSNGSGRPEIRDLGPTAAQERRIVLRCGGLRRDGISQVPGSRPIPAAGGARREFTTEIER